MARNLRNRRAAEVQKFVHDGTDYFVTFSRTDEGRVNEVFIKAGKPGSALDAWSRDAGIVLSIALQSGVQLADLADSVTKLDDGVTPAGAFGTIIKFMAEEPLIPPPIYQPGPMPVT